ncbi:GNAT family acetyltransferase [Brevibacillus choshinensis]|uniref:GNAT family acetyltransferase n=1 Tax=Brevibacillus choshinensis TaxID=54911 RepID=A0ABR5N504_BRECH|nr:GNAT family protein [Brevibacillus choshinensis]KQL45713.1 GNAT family acetyltransferase [Brevibacillus choshinensis]
MPIYLQGEKVVLRDIRPEDIDVIYMWKYEAQDREHLNWNGPYKPLDPLTKEEHRSLPRHQESLGLVGTDAPRTELILEIDGQLRGSVGRYWVSEETNWCEIGIVIYDSRYWSNGYGSEAFQMWIDYLFTHMDTVRLGIGTWSGNERMIKLAARCGMQEEARVRKARIVRGEYYDAIKMGMLKEEWEALQSRQDLRNK